MGKKKASKKVVEPVSKQVEPVAQPAVDEVKKAVVKKGVNITSKRGVLSEGDEVKTHYVNCNLQDLVDKGFCKWVNVE
jgi:hypothetical protein